MIFYDVYNREGVALYDKQICSVPDMKSIHDFCEWVGESFRPYYKTSYVDGVIKELCKVYYNVYMNYLNSRLVLVASRPVSYGKTEIVLYDVVRKRIVAKRAQPGYITTLKCSSDILAVVSDEFTHVYKLEYSTPFVSKQRIWKEDISLRTSS